jgi:hypothetical protein
MRGKGKGGTHGENIEEENNGYVVFKYRGKTPHEREGKGRANMRETWRRRITVTSSLNTEGKLPMRVKGKGGTYEGNMEEENNGYVVFKYRGKTPHESEGKGRHI